MSSISESVSQRMTLGYIQEHYGFSLEPPYASMVTVTSLANDPQSVRPGALYIPAASTQDTHVTRADIDQAIANGAYAVLLDESMRGAMSDEPVPVLYGNPSEDQLGRLAAQIAGEPSQTLAIFTVTGTDQQLIAQGVRMLAQFLHMLGNPVGTISATDSQSLERALDLHYPIDMFAMQQTLAVCAEDGAAAVIIAMDDETLQPGSLESVSVDVIGCDGVPGPKEAREFVLESCERFGCEPTDTTRIVGRTEESDMMAVQADCGHDTVRQLSLAIAMALAAGVRKNNIRSALRVSKEMH